MPRRMIRCLLWVLVLMMMAVIFAFSAQPGAASNAMTETAVMPVAELLASMHEGSGEETIALLYIIFGTIVRKVAHVCEYALLALLLAMLLSSYDVNWRWPAVLITILFAITDEIHQAFVPDRLGTPVDVLIDAVGAFAGVAIHQWLVQRREKKHANG